MNSESAKEELKVFSPDPDIIAWIAVSIYVIYFSLISFVKYRYFIYNDFDLAVHAQTIYNILHGSITSSILGVPFLGNHLNFILFLVAPVYAVFRSSLTLLVLQSLALGLSGYPVYLIAKEQLGKRFGLLMLFSYLVYPSLSYMNLYEFHPSAFATLFICAALYFVQRDNFRAYLISIILAILCQENIPLVIMFMGLYLAVTRRPFKWWFITVILSGLFFWVGVYKLIPYFGKGTIKFMGIYGYLGGSVGEIIKNILTHPVPVLFILLMKNNLIYISHIFGPVSFLPLLSPITFLAGLPTLLQHMLSLRSTEHTIYYHYTAELIPFVFFSSIFGFKKVLSLKSVVHRSDFMAAAFLVITIGSSLAIGPAVSTFFILDKGPYGGNLNKVKDGFIKMIPREAETVATFEFLPKLSNRQKLYSLHHAVMGTYTLSDRPYELPKSTQYALVDFEDWKTFRGTFYMPASGANLRRLFIDGDFGILDISDNVVLFKKREAGKYGLYRILPAEPVIPKKCDAVVKAEIELAGYDMSKVSAHKDIIEFKFFWRSLKKTGKTYQVLICVMDDKGRIRKTVPRFICYRVYPTNEWVPGQVIEEFYRLVLPSDLQGRGCRIRLNILDYETGRFQRLDSDIPGAVTENESIFININ